MASNSAPTNAAAGRWDGTVVPGAEVIAAVLREELERSVEAALREGRNSEPPRARAAVDAWDARCSAALEARTHTWTKWRPEPAPRTPEDALDVACLGPSRSYRGALSTWASGIRRRRRSGADDEAAHAFVEAAAHHDWTVRCARLARTPGQGALLRRELRSESRAFDARRHPLRALLELELNVRLRDAQSALSDEMLAASERRSQQPENVMYQLNMGEGKTFVILPTLAAEMVDGEALARITLLAPLAGACRRHLQHALGGVLGIRVWELPFNRDVRLNGARVAALSAAFNDCVADGGVLVTVPEHRLSFQLKVHEMRLAGDDAASAARELWERVEAGARDVLDECDEILHPKYQLVYTYGPQAPLAGNAARWDLASAVLSATRLFSAELAEEFPDVVELVREPAVDGGVLGLRLASGEAAEAQTVACADRLRRRVAGMVLERHARVDGVGSLALPVVASHSRVALEFVSSASSPIGWSAVAGDLEPDVLESLLILRGLLAYEVLAHSLTRVWRVHYGVRAEALTSASETRMAVPFRAADVPAPRAEFGHADVAILLTTLSYTYAGLSSDQFGECVERLVARDDAAHQYERWLRWCSAQARLGVPPAAAAINIRDHDQMTRMYVAFARNPAAVELWLSMYVFPRECKRFPYKLSASAWDLCPPSDACAGGALPKRKFAAVGFSGSVDAKMCFPHGVQQRLVRPSTSGEVVLNMTGAAGDPNVDVLPRAASVVQEVLGLAVLARCRVLLDASALAVGRSTEDVARAWLDMVRRDDEERDDAWEDGGSAPDAAVFFRERDDEAMVIGVEASAAVRLRDSPRAGDLSRCVVLLDQARTRGVDLKFPPRAKALVTVGPGLTKDRLAQACMRMRRLGEGQSVRFAVAGDALTAVEKPTPASCVSFCLRQTQRELRDGLVHWAAQAQSFCVHASGEPVEPERHRLEELYGPARVPLLVRRTAREAATTVLGPERVVGWERWAGSRLDALVPEFTRVAQALDEEQERELEQEEEREVQVERPRPMPPHAPRVSDEARAVARGGDPATLPGLVCLDGYFASRAGIKFPLEWGDETDEVGVWCTTAFADTVKVPVGETSTEFLRMVAWVASSARTSDLVLLSAFEANELMPAYRENGERLGVSLHAYLPRCRTEQWSCLWDALEVPAWFRRRGAPTSHPPLVLRAAAGSLFFAKGDEEAEWTAHAAKLPHRRAVSAIVEARWAGSASARHVGSDVAVWLLKPLI